MNLPRINAPMAHTLNGTWYSSSIHMYAVNQAGGATKNLSL